ncbi:MAG: homoserine O-succinyltransferase [Rhodospirillales bacterium]|nr:homoserine O-succinyltransferase [Alphaproteobacteria bacterium]MCB9981671.1 homoserine O-succinyltransferase [Rhodospirillales bacterium]
MPLVAYKDLPAFKRLRKEGRTVLSPERALTQEIRELHIGLLNMMPDAALQATERQFFRLIGESNQIAQFYVHPFTLAELARSAETQSYIDQYYENFDQIKTDGLDGLIITGANVSDPDLSKAPFWEPLQEVISWAWENVTSTLCSCLATHAVMQFQYAQTRTPMDKKLWGVYPHRVLDRNHPLMRGVNTVFDVPHSRYNELTQEQFEAAGLKVLSVSDDGDVHMAVSPDGFRQLLFQGHPEYDTISLYKEYEREVKRFIAKECADYPPFPDHYFNDDLKKLMKQLAAAVKRGQSDWPLTDDDMRQSIENSWGDSARSIIANWVGLVYQITNMERTKPFMADIDPDNPLGGI